MRTILALLSLLLCSTLSAQVPKEIKPAQIEFSAPDRIVWTGTIFPGDQQRFVDVYHANPGVTVLEIRDSNGGETRSAWELAQTVRGLGMTVIAKGRCVSACAVVFMHGARRELAKGSFGKPTFLQIHGTYNGKTGQATTIPGRWERVSKLYADVTAGRFPQEWLERAFFVPDIRGGLLIYANSTASLGGSAEIFFCNGDELLKPLSCTPVKGASALAWGVVTQ